MIAFRVVGDFELVVGAMSSVFFCFDKFGSEARLTLRCQLRMYFTREKCQPNKDREYGKNSHVVRGFDV